MKFTRKWYVCKHCKNYTTNQSDICHDCKDKLRKKPSILKRLAETMPENDTSKSCPACEPKRVQLVANKLSEMANEVLERDPGDLDAIALRYIIDCYNDRDRLQSSLRTVEAERDGLKGVVEKLQRVRYVQQEIDEAISARLPDSCEIAHNELELAENELSAALASLGKIGGERGAEDETHS